MSQHTPTPYRLVQHETDEYPEHHPSHCRLVGANHICIGILFGEIEEVREAREFIVRAVNAHEELVEALRDCMWTLKDAGYTEYHPTIERARATLLKLEE